MTVEFFKADHSRQMPNCQHGVHRLMFSILVNDILLKLLGEMKTRHSQYTFNLDVF